MSKHVQPATATGKFAKFDYTTLPADIVDQLRAAADRVSKLQRAAVTEIGRTLIEVKHHIRDDRFVAWVQRECKIPISIVRQAIEAVELADLATTLLLESTLPGSNQPHDIAEQKKHRRRAKPPALNERVATSPWVVTREPGADRRRTRDQLEEREWGGEANLRKHYACTAAKILENLPEKKRTELLTAMSKTDLRAVLDVLPGAPPSAPRNPASATDRHAEDEPPLPFVAISAQENRDNNASCITEFSRQNSPLECVVQKNSPPLWVQMKYGEMRHRCLDAMRDGSAITAESVVMRLMRDRSLDPHGDKHLRSDLLKRALRALDALRRCGRVQKIGKGRGVRWLLVVK